MKNYLKFRYKTDGLVNLKYTLVSKELRPLYTNVTVILEKPKKTTSRSKRETSAAEGYTLRGTYTDDVSETYTLRDSSTKSFNSTV